MFMIVYRSLSLTRCEVGVYSLSLSYSIPQALSLLTSSSPEESAVILKSAEGKEDEESSPSICTLITAILTSTAHMIPRVHLLYFVIIVVDTCSHR